MHKTKDKSTLYRKYTPTLSHQPTYLRTEPSYEPSQCNTNESAFSNKHKLKQTIQGSSSRIADEVQPFETQYDEFRDSILKKVVCIEEETNTLLEKKQKQLYFLKIQLQNNETRLLQAQQALIIKDQQIEKLRKEQNKGRGKEQYCFLIEQNRKLKQSLKTLIDQKNQGWRQSTHDNYSQHNQPYVERLKKEVQELRLMVAEMQKMVHNCPSCFTLSRNLQELNESYTCLLKEHTKLKHFNHDQEQHHLKNITKQIQENQNIVRQNNHLRGERQSKYYLRPKREKLKESVAKRCRTLTDQF